VRNWLRALALAVVFTLVGAFAASLWLEVRRDAASAPEGPPGRWHGRAIRVEVINGAGVRRLARRATEHLRELGFDVVYYGNAEQFDRDSSVAIARTDSIEPARRVADALGVLRVERRVDHNLFLDVSLILGRDWVEPRQEETVGALEVWWSRIRRATARLWPG